MISATEGRTGIRCRPRMNACYEWSCWIWTFLGTKIFRLIFRSRWRQSKFIGCRWAHFFLQWHGDKVRASVGDRSIVQTRSCFCQTVTDLLIRIWKLTSWSFHIPARKQLTCNLFSLQHAQGASKPPLYAPVISRSHVLFNFFSTFSCVIY